MAADDPFYDIKADIEAALHQVGELQRTSSSTSKARSLELSTALDSLAQDVEDADASVQALERDPHGVLRNRLGIKEGEVRSRRTWVAKVQDEIKRLRSGKSVDASLARTAAPSDPLRRQDVSSSSFALDDDDAEEARQSTDGKYEAQQQQLLFAQQDETLGSIGATVDALRAQAATMGTEMREQNSLLDLLAQDVDSTDSKLSSARRKMDRFIRDNRDSPSSWCIVILIFILMILLVLLVII